MGNYFLAAGLLLNSVLIVINRFWRRIPDRLYLPCLITGIILILIGAVQLKSA